MCYHKQLVIDEKEELDRRTNVLHAFFDTPIFESLPTAEKLRLDKQWKLMVQLSDVLDERIQYLNEEPTSSSREQP